MQPTAGDGAAINLLERAGIDPKLRFVLFYLVRQTCFRHGVGLEIQQPDLLRQQNSEVHLALHHDKIVSRQWSARGQTRKCFQVGGGQARGEFHFSIDGRGGLLA